MRATYFSSVGPVLHNVGGIKYQPFLTTGKEQYNVLKWNRVLRFLSKMEPRALVNCLSSYDSLFVLRAHF